MAVSSGRDIDVTIFGATGFTGQHIVAEAVASLPADTRIAIAGRDTAKLTALAARLGASDRLLVIGGVDVSNTASLQAMAARTRLIVSAVGPFRLLGEAVLAAAVAGGADYVDICGEPEFIESAVLRYGPAAAARGCVIINAAGFDSVPADMGALFAADALAPATPAAVECVISVDAPHGTSIHYATWEAAVHGIGAADSLRKLRRDARTAGTLPPPPPLLGPRPAAPEAPTWDDRLGRYTLPFPGADASVVRRTQAALAARGRRSAVHFSARFSVPGAVSAAQFTLFGGLMMALARVPWGRSMLLRFYSLFSRGLVSHEGPTREQMEATRVTLDLFASGYSAPPLSGEAADRADQQVHAQVTLGDPGYIYTSKILVCVVQTLLAERSALLEATGTAGGAFTVGELFWGSGLLQRLLGVGVGFEVL